MNRQRQEAKSKLKKVVEEASKSGPQVIIVRGKEAAVILSIEEYGELTRRKEKLLEFFRRLPLRGSGIVVERVQDFDREVEL